MKKSILNISLSLVAVFGSLAGSAQCPTITCPGNTVVSNDNGTCGAVVNYTAPVGTNPCPNTSTTFSYTGAIDTWTVPAGVTSIRIEARGAEGGYNTSSTHSPGLGAIMIGDFNVTPGSTLNILVGEQPATTNGNGGGGGSFVTDASNNPLVVAGGGGGSSQTTDSPDKHGNITTTGGTGAAGGGAGGTAGNGGSVGASGFQSGAGGGLLTNGADGWTGNTGGLAFLNGGSGGTANGNARGGFGGGGSGSSHVVGGGGGGYSGGGSGGNSSAGVGGGGASFNGGTNQNNTGGANSGHGEVIISWSTIPVSTAQIAGLASGATFPVGVTTNTFVVTAGSVTDTCSFTVTVNDTEIPTITCPGNVVSCVPTVNSIAPTTSDNCPGETVTYALTGATTGTGSSDASGTSFNQGITSVKYYVTDAAGNIDSCSFDVEVLVPLTGSETSTICNNGSVVVNGTTYNAANPTGVEVFTNVGPNNCDSTVTINLNVLPALTGSETSTICNTDSVVVNGTTYNAANPSGVEVFTNVGPNGCDSTVTINLNVLPALTGSLTSTICNNDSIVVNGTTYNAANPTGVEVFTNVGPNNCDSTVTVNLTVLPALTGSVTSTICNTDSIVVNGTTYNAANPTGVEVFTNVGPNGCDSTVTINLTVLPAIDVTVTNNSPSLTSNESGAVYQWLDCDNSFAMLTGETNQIFTASANGNYAVEVTVGGCVDTSACESVHNVGIDENDLFGGVNIFPNPAKNIINVTLEGINKANLTVYKIDGTLVYQNNGVAKDQTTIDLSGYSKGVYFLKLEANDQTKVYKVIKQ